MVPLLLQVRSQSADVWARLLSTLACKQKRRCTAVLRQAEMPAGRTAAQVGLLALSLFLNGLALCGCLVKPPVHLWQLRWQVPHA